LNKAVLEAFMVQSDGYQKSTAPVDHF